MVSVRNEYKLKFEDEFEEDFRMSGTVVFEEKNLAKLTGELSIQPAYPGWKHHPCLPIRTVSDCEGAHILEALWLLELAIYKGASPSQFPPYTRAHWAWLSLVHCPAFRISILGTGYDCLGIGYHWDVPSVTTTSSSLLSLDQNVRGTLISI